MATRATIRFATREEGVPFDKHPEKWHAQFYNHWDGYPEGLGVMIAESFTNYGKIQGWEVEALDIVHDDVEYIYYIWQAPLKTTWISIFRVGYRSETENGECIFVGEPQQLINKYKINTNNDG